jgi:hypothetical protein
LLALDKKTYELAGVSTPGNSPGSYKEPGFGWMAGFLLAISFVGLLNLLPLRKVPSLLKTFSGSALNPGKLRTFFSFTVYGTTMCFELN